MNNICTVPLQQFFLCQCHSDHYIYLIIIITSCARGDTICPAPLLRRRAPPSRRNVAVLSHAEYVPTLTAGAALRVKAALSKAAW